MYLDLIYKPTTLFSLKQSAATNSAGKSLIAPSPYAIKMALLNAIITFDSLSLAKNYFKLVRDLHVSFSLPNEIVVNNCMIKILKMKRNEFSSKEKKILIENGMSKDEIKSFENTKKVTDPFQTTIAFREYVYFDGQISFAIEIPQDSDKKQEQDYDFLKYWFMHINYFGKKGCFFQFVRSEILDEIDEENYSSLLGENQLNGLIYQMDDMSKKNNFEDVNTYSSKKTKREKKIFVFPYKIIESNKSYTLLRKYNL